MAKSVFPFVLAFLSLSLMTDDSQQAQQEWNIYRRKYNYFLKRDGEMDQFGSTDSGFLAWDFDIANEKEEIIGSINRSVLSHSMT